MTVLFNEVDIEICRIKMVIYICNIFMTYWSLFSFLGIPLPRQII